MPDGTILRSVVDHDIVTPDAEGAVTSRSEGAERILGRREADILGRSADVFFTAEDCDDRRPEEEMRTASAEGRAEDERWHVRKGRERFWGWGPIMPLPADAVGPERGEKIGIFVKVFRYRIEERAPPSDRSAREPCLPGDAALRDGWGSTTSTRTRTA